MSRQDSASRVGSEQARTANQRLTDVARHVIDADFPPCPAGNCDAAAGTRRMTPAREPCDPGQAAGEPAKPWR